MYLAYINIDFVFLAVKLFSCDALGTTLNLECGPGLQIDVLYGDYGRRSPTPCPPMYTENTDCGSHTPTTLKTVKESCQGSRSCTLQGAGRSWYTSGDPCSGTQKYLEVHYNCSTNGQYSSLPHYTK